MSSNHLGFTLRSSAVESNILIPKYYDPEIAGRLSELARTHDLLTIEEMIQKGWLSWATGDEIGKMAYGTGSIPFIRTSDISNWEIKADPKHAVSEEIYRKYAAKQDVQAGDILFVRDGTYLVGTSCMVSQYDEIILYQSHIIKFRVTETSPIDAYLFLGLLSTPIVRRQVRAKQFTADIIDSIGNRFLELVLPVPSSEVEWRKHSDSVRSILDRRVELREKARQLPYIAEGIIDEHVTEGFEEEDTRWGTRFTNFKVESSSLSGNILIPKYYDPNIGDRLRELSQDYDLKTIGELVDAGLLHLATGDEVGKMAYGTGHIPFVRTSDISNWELKRDPKQSVGEHIYRKYKHKQDVQAYDLFVVRDGTYLVGNVCILLPQDIEILYCGGIYKIRVVNQEELDPFLLLVLLSTPIVRKQIRAKQFTRDVIDTLGHRIQELVLPVPKSREVRQDIANQARSIVEERARLRDLSLRVARLIEGEDAMVEETD